MKFYRVNQNKIIGITLGNSTAPTFDTNPICNNRFVKVNEDGKVFTINDTPVLRNRLAGQKKSQLILSAKDLELFTECSDPGNKAVSNIEYHVVARDYDGYYIVERHKDVMTATQRCGILNDSTSEYHEVHVEFDYEWEN
ncbi:hypothetical protein CPT_Melin_047 [Acinetobacter phage Melin]|nr:hypothetical protein CPT_Melin_047 [Acinetobacter phage Melin]